MISKFLRSIVIICIAGSALFASQGNSSCNEDQKKPHKGMMAELNLTADQKTKLKALHEQGNISKASLKQKSEDLRIKIKDEFLKKTPDANLLNTYSTQFGNIAAEQSKARFEFLLQLKSILTDEQFQKIATKKLFEGPAEGNYKHSCKENRPENNHSLKSKGQCITTPAPIN